MIPRILARSELPCTTKIIVLLSHNSALQYYADPGIIWDDEMIFMNHVPVAGSLTRLVDQGTISLKLLGGKLAPKLVYFVLRKEVLKL